MKKNSVTLGVLGGMGPAATVDLLGKIVESTPATCDQEHLAVVAVSDPDILDRTAAILGYGPDPWPALLERLQHLLRLEPGLIVLPCHTAHYWFDQLQEHSPVPLLHMIQVVADRVQAMLGRGRAAGLMATSGTLAAGLYQESLGQRGLETLVPDPDSQKELMEIIRGVKAGLSRTELCIRARAVSGELRRAGAELLVLGCTEVPLLLAADDVGIPLLDATRVLAERAVEAVGGRDNSGQA